MAKSIEDRDDMILDLIRGRYDSEQEKLTNLDGKASNLIGFVSVVVGLIVGGGAFKLSIIAGTFYLWLPYFGGVVLLLASIFFGLKAFAIRNWLVAPDVNALFPILADTNNSYSYDTVLKATAGAMVTALSDTESKNKNKSDHIDHSWWLLIFGLIAVGIFLGIFAFSGAAIQNDSNQ